MKSLRKNIVSAADAGRVGVLLGGLSSEREVSLMSGAAVCAALGRLGIDAVAIDIGADAVEQITRANIDVAFLILHGPGGEDGTIQGLLEYLRIPYTGSGVMASALAMDKLRCKQMWLGLQLPTPAFAFVDESFDALATLERLGGKVIVKPATEGSSIGMTIADTPADLEHAIQVARQYDDDVMVEQWIAGPEYTVSVLDGEILPPIRLQPAAEFYDYNAKYISEETRYHCPCGLDEEAEVRLKKLAKAAFDSVGCQGWGRVDVMSDEQQNFYLLEVNTLPGMTSHSLVPMAAKVAGLSFDDLVLKILQTAHMSEAAHIHG